MRSGDDGSITFPADSQQEPPSLCESDPTLFPASPHGLRPPLWLGRQVWTIPPNSLPASATDGGRFLVCGLFPGHHYSLDFFNLISSHFVDLTSASSSGPFDAPFSAPELAQALAQCHDSAPGHDGLPYSAFKPDLPWWRGMLLQFFNMVLHWNTVPAAWKISTVGSCVSNVETLQVQTSTAPSLWHRAPSRFSSA